eukprot:478764-Prorocentrum_minimum.AAC.1
MCVEGSSDGVGRPQCVDCLRGLGLTEAGDAMVCEGTIWLLKNQQTSGNWPVSALVPNKTTPNPPKKPKKFPKFQAKEPADCGQLASGRWVPSFRIKRPQTPPERNFRHFRHFKLENQQTAGNWP